MDPLEIKKRDPFPVHQVKSFGFAFEGIFYSFKKGTHFKIECLALVLVVILGFIYSISETEWIIIVVISSAILGAEAMNTGLEELGDVLHPEHHPRIRLAKHCAAAGVLILSIAAVVIGVIIFAPRIFS